MFIHSSELQLGAQVVLVFRDYRLACRVPLGRNDSRSRFGLDRGMLVTPLYW